MILNRHQFQYKDNLIHFEVGNYQNNGRIAIQTVCDNGDFPGEPYATITVNMPEIPLDEGEFIVKTWTENKPITDFLRNSEFFVDTGKRMGFQEAEVWKLKEGVEFGTGNLSTPPEKWLEELFQDHYCEECGGDAQHHTAVPLNGNWFARCDYPPDKNGKLHSVIQKYRKD